MILTLSSIDAEVLHRMEICNVQNLQVVKDSLSLKRGAAPLPLSLPRPRRKAEVQESTPARVG